jgi:hypothetical protein
MPDAIMADPPVQPAPVSAQVAPTRFSIKSDYRNKHILKSSTVDAEFNKYISDSTSSTETDILRFWEVR